jgi:hypothetical protein
MVDHPVYLLDERPLNVLCGRASELLQYVPRELRIASLEIKIGSPMTMDSTAQQNELAEEDMLRTARGYFMSKEYARAASTLDGCTTPKARFLCLYSQFLVIQPV